MNLTNAQKAAKHFLNHCGQRGTQKQIDSLLNKLGADTVIRMAVERGFVSSEIPRPIPLYVVRCIGNA